MDEIVFNRSDAPTIGVEIEFQILDGQSLELAPLSPHILRMVRPPYQERFKTEFITSMLEINTGICSTVSEVEDDLRRSYGHLTDIAEGFGATLYAASLHPFSRGAEQSVSDHPRYRRIMQELQVVGRRFITQGFHVHIGVDEREKAIVLNNKMRIYLPILLALSTSSPFYESEDTGLMSYRSKLFESLPLAGMPDSLDDWKGFNSLVTLLKKGGIIESVKDIWWDVRPHPDFGTIEIRICDLPCSMRDILGITALVQALVVALSEQFENPDPHIQILRSNKWQAARHGLNGVYVDPIFGKRRTMREAALDLYRLVKPFSEMLKSADYLEEIPEILKRGSGAHLQKKLYYGNGNSFPMMINAMKEKFLT
jgi:carboxylate-amine ligase